MKKIRCAIYTRKSSEEGLGQEFNSLDAQREACEAYIASQRHEGWVLLPEVYDDGGLSGGSLKRPALQEIMKHVEDGRVDQIVVYKIDRLTRSLADFAKIVDILDAAKASFVSVTQSFNTATSMGRLTLNMLLSFAQFEREVTAERIRDKITASKRKGLWMGGTVPMGYDPDGRTLKVNEVEAETIRTLYDLYEQYGSVRAVREEAEQLGLRTRLRKFTTGNVSGGGPFDRGHIYYILTNPIFAGKIRHRKLIHEGLHDPIIDPERWEQIQVQLQDGASRWRSKVAANQKSLLCGKLFDETGDRLTPSHSKTRKGIRLRYYISHRLVTRSREDHLDAWRLPAPELENKSSELVRSMFRGHAFAMRLAPGSRAEEIGRIRSRLSDLNDTEDIESLFRLIDRINIAPGNIQINLNSPLLAEELGVSADTINHDVLTQNFPFQLRKRGVETRLVLTDSPTGIDDTLACNIARAHGWFEQLKTGKTFAEVAQADETSPRRVQQLIELAFLAPDIVRQVLEGNQPLGFTSKWCLQRSLPSDWTEQRQVLATL
ncbi:MAG: recombinase family protein [Rhodospirillales bacterium]|nr:recombinase family protein [Rhodospirillales bacterium]MBT4625340.1 recombinase family protein [Rhodospirillales bacterium]MBT5352599.1 recombinase family protein [Rhodospirillales bacterium]MBT6111124.1 recombinase family protein [Rhodospirillales bacterium]MBT6826669.1 recombinase family protein [Rhodospirillales bacterium]